MINNRLLLSNGLSIIFWCFGPTFRRNQLNEKLIRNLILNAE